jgi:hypothetical protein
VTTLMGKSSMLFVGLATISAVVATTHAAASEVGAAPLPGEYIYLQVWLGALDTDSSWEVSDPSTGESAIGDLGTLPFGGGAGQQLWGDGAWQYGYEGGALATWKNDNTEFRGRNGTLLIEIDNTFFAFGVFMGGVVSVNPLPNLRLYAAAGPSVTWGFLDDDDDGDNNNLPPPPGNSFVIDLDDGSNDVSVTAYARAGFEIILNNGFAFGFSVRYADDEFNFDDAGDLTLDDPLWLLTLGGRF